MTTPHISEDILSTLSEENAVFMRDVRLKMCGKKEVCDRFCEFVARFMTENDRKVFLSLSDDIRYQACFDYIVIGIVSGSITKKDIRKVTELK